MGIFPLHCLLPTSYVSPALQYNYYGTTQLCTWQEANLYGNGRIPSPGNHGVPGFSQWNYTTSLFTQSPVSNCYRASNTFASTQCTQDSSSACYICDIGYYLSGSSCVANATLYYANFLANVYYSAGYGQLLADQTYQLGYTQCSTPTQFIQADGVCLVLCPTG